MTDIINTSDYHQQASEHQLQVLVLNFLAVEARSNIFYFAVPNAGLRSLPMGMRMKHEGLRPGIADLCIMLPDGRCAWLEMKTQKGRQSLAQKGFQNICRRLGHHYAVARSLDEAIAFLDSVGALK